MPSRGTITTGDVALYSALYGMRFPVQSSDAFAQSVGLARSPVDALLLFHVVFGKTVPDISLNAVANLGYADCKMLRPAWPGDSFTARSKVIGLRGKFKRQDRHRVRLDHRLQSSTGQEVLTYIRWVMVAKQNTAVAAYETVVPSLPEMRASR